MKSGDAPKSNDNVSTAIALIEGSSNSGRPRRGSPGNAATCRRRRIAELVRLEMSPQPEFMATTAAGRQIAIGEVHALMSSGVTWASAFSAALAGMSITTSGATRSSTGSSATDLPSAVKCSGASICVPVCSTDANFVEIERVLGVVELLVEEELLAAEIGRELLEEFMRQILDLGGGGCGRRGVGADADGERRGPAATPVR